jgi:hypothetical protein
MYVMLVNISSDILTYLSLQVGSACLFEC